MLPGGRWSARSAPSSAATTPTRRGRGERRAASATGNAPLEAASLEFRPRRATTTAAASPCRCRSHRHVTSRLVSSRLVSSRLRPSARPLRTSAVSSAVRRRAPSRTRHKRVPLFLPRFFPRSPLPLSAVDLSYRSPFLSFEPRICRARAARRGAMHALTLRTHDLAPCPLRTSPVAAVAGVAGTKSQSLARRRRRRRAFYAAIGALRWPSLECARPHRS